MLNAEEMPTNMEILECMNEVNLLRLLQKSQIEDYLVWYFMSYKKSPGGKSFSEVDKMSPFEKIVILEEIVQLSFGSTLPQSFYEALRGFLGEVDRQLFEGADDYHSCQAGAMA